MDLKDLNTEPHRRYNILTREWVLVSPHRTKRPWQGQEEDIVQQSGLTYDPTCYLCPGNTRAGGHQNENYDHTFVFTNDFAALKQDVSVDGDFSDGLLKSHVEKGLCKVICFSPNHQLTLPVMEVSDIERVVRVWQKEYLEIGALEDINYVQIFENKGETMGCSNPHPHGQIWASRGIPDEPAKEQVMQLAYFQKNNRSLLGDYIKQELKANERIVVENDHFVALVPFWAVWPYETMIVSKKHLQHIGQFDHTHVSALADIVKRLTIRYDNLFLVSFPYSAGIHQAPTDGEAHSEWHFHIHCYPPLLRSATVKKFMVGYELLGNPQRHITAELSADILKGLSDIHYSEKH